MVVSDGDAEGLGGAAWDAGADTGAVSDAGVRLTEVEAHAVSESTQAAAGTMTDGFTRGTLALLS